MPFNPNLSDQEQPQQAAQSLLDLVNPYGGRTVNQILEGGNPYGDTYENGSPVNGPGDGSFANWQNQLATNANVSDAIQRGGRYRPEIARTLQSSGAEGGFFSIPGEGGGERSIPWGYYDDPRKESPAPGLLGMSTNNWRLLPKQFQDPRWAMRAGHIIERLYGDKPGAYIASHGGIPPQEGNQQTTPLGGGGHGFPLGYGSGPTGLHFFPGQLEPALSDRWGG